MRRSTRVTDTHHAVQPSGTRRAVLRAGHAAVAARSNGIAFIAATPPKGARWRGRCSVCGRLARSRRCADYADNRDGAVAGRASPFRTTAVCAGLRSGGRVVRVTVDSTGHSYATWRDVLCHLADTNSTARARSGAADQRSQPRRWPAFVFSPNARRHRVAIVLMSTGKVSRRQCNRRWNRTRRVQCRGPERCAVAHLPSGDARRRDSKLRTFTKRSAPVPATRKRLQPCCGVVSPLDCPAWAQARLQ